MSATDLLSTLPTKEIVSLYNRIPGTPRVSRFENRTIAIRRMIDALDRAGLVLADTGGIIDFASGAADEPHEDYILPNTGPLAVASDAGPRVEEPGEDPLAIPPALRRGRGADEAPEGEAEQPAEVAAEDAAVAPTAAPQTVDGRERCPHCGRPMAKRREQAPRPPREPSQPRAGGSKEATVIEMLRRPDGATLDQIVAATGWQKHTIRGAFAGALKKKRGLTIVSEKISGGSRIYRIAE